MNSRKLFSLLELNEVETPRWERYVVDTLLALGSIILLTGLIFLLHIYPGVPDSFLVYLLAVLGLAGLRGLYASLLASFLAFFSFDFLFISPLYSLTVSKFADVLTLIAFLFTAILTSQLTSLLRQRARDARHREQEMRMLYDILRAINRQENVERQLATLAHSILEVYSSRGVHNCSFLLAHGGSEATLLVSPPSSTAHLQLSPTEAELVKWVQAHGSLADLDIDESGTGIEAAVEKQKRPRERHRYTRLIPLKTDQQIIGILRLEIEEDGERLPLEHGPGQEYDHPSAQGIYFSAFLEQAVTIIEQGRLRNESLQAKVLQQTDALRSALLSSISHDLRTPLATIKTSATSLMQKNVEWNEDARQGFVAAIEREADRLNGLVENLLDMSRIEAGALHPEKVWYPLDELVHDVLARMRERVQGRVIRVDIPTTLPPIELDYVQIDQVVTNMLENALNHTPAGSPIDVSICYEGEQVRVSIADRGPGVPAGEQELIFDKFYRILGKQPVASKSRGSGLGLAICRALVEAHGGRIWVEARAGGGSIFQFTLPVSQIEEAYEQT